MKHKWFFWRTSPLVFLFISTLLLLAGCNATRLIPEDEYLLNSVEIRCNNKNIDKSELESYVKQKPNRKILSFIPFNLQVYNLTNFGKERKWKSWLANVIGEEPVIYDVSLNRRSINQLEQFLKNKGYYDAIVSNSISFGNKRINLTYNVNTGKPYVINKIVNQIDDPYLKPIILNDSMISLLHEGMIFDIDRLENERTRITKLLRLSGYYYFSKDYIRYTADTSQATHLTTLTIQILKHNSQDSTGQVITDNHTKYRINNIYFYTDYDPSMALSQEEEYFEHFDTLFYKGYYFIYRKKLKIKPDIILMANNLGSDRMYNSDDVDKTYKFLNGLKVFRLINIQFSEVEKKYGENKLDCFIQLTPFTTQGYAVEAEGNNTSGNIGIEGNVTYQHRNLFGGAELFNVRLRGAIQGQRTKKDNQKDYKIIFNTFEYGIETGLDLPKFLLPFKAHRFYKRYNPKTNISVSYNHQNRPDFIKTVANSSFGYYWNGSKYSTHQVTPIQLNTVKIFSMTEDFARRIDTTFQKYSFKDMFISEMGYSYTFGNQNINKLKNFIYLKTNVSSGGNVISLYYNAFDKNAFKDTTRRIFGLDYAQFAMGDIDFRYYQLLDRFNSVVYRFYIGAGVPYGNSKAMPFVKQFYSGGANGIRGWQVKSLGPGTYLDTASSNKNYKDQTADFKIEFNLEYRFDIFLMLKGAFFIDGGNIWALNSRDNRQGAQFNVKKFYRQIALGTGLGLRADLKFFIFRVDMGLKAYDPSINPANEGNDKHWVLGTRKMTRDDWMVNMGIGYPF